MASVCSVCTIPGKRLVEFESVKELAQHIKAGHPLPRKVQQQEQQEKKQEEEEKKIINTPREKKPEKVSPPKPPRLVYTYQGECPSCGSVVDTITVNLPNFDTVVAYCTSCKSQIASRNVIPIEKQKIK